MREVYGEIISESKESMKILVLAFFISLAVFEFVVEPGFLLIIPFFPVMAILGWKSGKLFRQGIRTEAWAE